ncbi:MAG: gamma-glutamylcyclotransferase family protein [Pseudomonadota bacterium]
MSAGYVFGYGSLVNAATRSFPSAGPGHLAGWRRVWRHLPGQTVATLSVERADGFEIEGMVAEVAAEDWPALDEREALYRRVQERSRGHTELDVTVYEVPKEHRDATDPQPILLSYLDVVIQGYLTLGGEAAVTAFHESTTGWGPIQDDRSAPLYPRHQILTSTERRVVDDLVARLG